MGIAIALALVALAGAVEGPSSRSAGLAGLFPSKDRVPACARLKPIAAGDELPCGMNTNPFVSREGKAVGCVAEMLLTTLAPEAGVKPAQVSEVGIAMYEARSEIGLIGLAFAEEAAAGAVAKAIEKKLGSEPRAALVTTGTIVVVFTCDPGVAEECCQAVKALALATVKPGAK